MSSEPSVDSPTGADPGAPAGAVTGRGTAPPEGRGAPAPRRVLLVQLRYMGDVLLCTPAIRAARAAFPEARIDFLTSAPGVDVLTGNPHLDEVIGWRPGVLAGWRLARALRRRGYDAVVDFQSTPRTARIARATGAATRIGVRGRGPRNRHYTTLVPREHSLLYTPLVKMQALAPLGVAPPADLALDIRIGEEERARARAIWERQGLEDGPPVVAISSVAREPWKQWGAERWAAVADGICDAGYRVLLSGGPGERAQVEAVVGAMRHVPVWDYGATTLRDLGAIYERCALWIGNDGGPKHVAAAAGARTITVFRWKIPPVWTDPNRPDEHLWLDAPPPGGCDMRCARCRHRGCLAAVAPERVVAMALPLLGAPSGPRLVRLGEA